MADNSLRFNQSLFRGVIPHFTPYDINNTDDLGGMTPLHWLCVKQLYCHSSQESDNLDTIKWLLKQGANTNTMTSTLGYTPLHILSLGRDSEEIEVSNVWALIKKCFETGTIEKNERLTAKNAAILILESGARMIRNKPHNLTPLALYMVRQNRENMKISTVQEIFPVDLAVRDLFELFTIKLCKIRDREQLLKIVPLSVKHGCWYLGNNDWNVSAVTQLMAYKCDLSLLVYSNEVFKGKLLPDYIPLVLPLEGQYMNEIFPLEETELLNEVRDVLGVYDTFGVAGLYGALNLLICEESMYISFEDMLCVYVDKVGVLSGTHGVKCLENILDNFVGISIERFTIKHSSSFNTLGAACLLIILNSLTPQDRITAKQILNSLIAKYKMHWILHRVIEMCSGIKTSYRISEGESSRKLVEFEWRNKLEIVLEFLEVQINNLDEDANTCLHVAINTMDTELITELLTRNAYPYAKNINGDTCIDLILRNITKKRKENSILHKKIDVLQSAPPMLKVLTADLIIQCGLWISEESLPVTTRNILSLHGYRFLHSPLEQPL